jgi:hypothetical protein
MLLTVASALLLVALVTDAGGSFVSLGAFTAWLFLVHRGSVPNSTSLASGAGIAVSASGRGLVLGVVAVGLVAAVLVRWPIASHDVTHYGGPDEGEVVENVLEMIRMEDWDHRHPGYPGLHFYLQMVPAKLHLASSSLTIPELPRAGFYLAARRLTLLAGVLSAGVVFLIGRTFLSPLSATLAAIWIAISPLAFRESAVVNPDLVLMLFVSVSLMASLRLLESRTWSAYLLAGVAVGLASAIKYTGVFALGPFFLAWLLGPDPRRQWHRWLCGVAVSAVAFLIASPYTLLNVSSFVRGLSMHVGYYQAASVNASLELTRQVATRGVGVLAAVAAFGGALRALVMFDRRLLVLLAYPASYWFVFSLFDRAYPRHALVLLPVVALVAADAFERLLSRFPMSVRALLAVVVVSGPMMGSFELWQRAHRPTPADGAAAWVEANLPVGARVLEDQHTPRLDPRTYRVHRIGVEEKRFVGNFDWVLLSGYPPGLSSRGLREAARFDNNGALGDSIIAYQVPSRETLMPRTFRGKRKRAALGAGNLAYFGQGWYPPSPGAFETSRLSRGETSEMFFLLEEASHVNAELVIGAAVGAGRLRLTLNDQDLGEVNFGGERESHLLVLQAEALVHGLNRLTLNYDEVVRLDRRHPDTAIRFYRLILERR